MCISLPQEYSDTRLLEELEFFRKCLATEKHSGWREYYQAEIDKLEKEVAERGLMSAEV